MNNYITLDSKKYVTPQQGWIPRVIKPSTVRLTLLGAIDATYGPGNILEWQAEIEAAVSPASGYGSPSDLRTSLQKVVGLSFTDHFSTSHTVHVRGFEETSMSPMWDGSSNVVIFNVTLMGQ